MPVKLAWYREPHVIVSFWLGVVSEEEAAQYLAELNQMIQGARAPVFILHDLGDVKQPVLNMGELRQYLHEATKNENVEMMIGYENRTPLVTFLMNFAARLMPLRFRAFNSWEEAQAFLESLDTGLDFSRRPTPPTMTP